MGNRIVKLIDVKQAIPPGEGGEDPTPGDADGAKKMQQIVQNSIAGGAFAV